jgi:hypothetical protein
MIDQVKTRNPNTTVVIVGMQFPIAALYSEYVATFVKIFGELAQKNHAALVPNLLEGVVGDPKLNLPDRIHPNAAGHKSSNGKCLARRRTDRVGSGFEITLRNFFSVIPSASEDLTNDVMITL